MDSKLDFFQKMYALNDDYHNKKEQMAWLASTIYLGFVVVSAKWLFETVEVWREHCPYVVCFLSTVFVFAVWFIEWQIKLKARTSRLTSKLQAFLPIRWLRATHLFRNQSHLHYAEEGRLEQLVADCIDIPCCSSLFRWSDRVRMAPH